MKIFYFIFSSLMLFLSCASLNQKPKTGNLSLASEKRTPASSGEKTYNVSVYQFMSKFRGSNDIRGPLLEVSSIRKQQPYMLLNRNNPCVSVKESDFKYLNLQVILFAEKNPVDACGKYVGKCSPAHYHFSAGNHRISGERVVYIPSKFMGPILGVKRNERAYYSRCPLIGNL